MMMTPEEKAFQLKESFGNGLTTRDCALICIDEILEALSYNSWQNRNEIIFFVGVKKQLQEL
jgi:hypothetical protein